MNIFLAFPFAGLINSETKEVSPEYKEFFENLINFIKSRGHTYYSAQIRQKVFRTQLVCSGNHLECLLVWLY